MNWLERARREIGEGGRRPTANTVERNLTAVTTVPHLTDEQAPQASIGGIGSTTPAQLLKSEAIREAFEERAAIMEYDGGLSRDHAERAAWALVLKSHRLH